MNLLDMTYAQLVNEFHRRYDRGAFHAAALYRTFYGAQELNLATLPAFANSPQLRQQVQKDLQPALLPVVRRVAEGEVCKLVFGLGDGLEVETVVIPMANHATVCISCQVGCRMQCGFCETGRMGLRRHLTTAEIVAQIYTVKVGLGRNVRNVVFMGMGEPLDNFDNVAQAIRVMEDQRGLNIAKRRITLSTVGLVEGIQRLAALNWPQLKLAVSLNAPNDAVRRTLMPINNHYPMAALKHALQTYPLARGNTLFMTYVLIRDVNDAPAHALELATYLEGLPVKLNLIPCNPLRQSPYATPAADAIARFQQILIARKIFVRLRASKGAGIRAACGQLGSSARH